MNALLPPPRRGGPTQISAPREGVIQSASELRAGDYVIYPSQGVHRVAGFERMHFAGQQLDVVRLEREHDGAAVVVPVGKVPSTGLRRVAARELIDDVFRLLGAVRDGVELDWRERHRENVERLMAGGVLGIAEVIKGLYALAQLRPLSPKDREQYDSARDLLVHEVAVSLAVPPGLAEDYIDYALTPPAGVRQARPKPKRAPWVPRRPERRHPAVEGLEGGAAPAKPVRAKRAATGERARKARPKKHAPPKRRVRKAGLAKRRVRKNRAPKRTSRARR